MPQPRGWGGLTPAEASCSWPSGKRHARPWQIVQDSMSSRESGCSNGIGVAIALRQPSANGCKPSMARQSNGQESRGTSTSRKAESQPPLT